jgi:phenylacetate-CoA ligase
VVEYRVEIDQSAALPVLRVELEPNSETVSDLAERVERAIRAEFLFRAEVRLVTEGSLPRFEMKARRVVKKS